MRPPIDGRRADEIELTPTHGLYHCLFVTLLQAWSKSGMRPTSMHSNPNRGYKNSGWRGWNHWLGIIEDRVPKSGYVAQLGDEPNDQHGQGSEGFLPFEEALGVARSLGLSHETGL